MKTLQQISYDGEWEVNKNELIIEEILGKGSFGVVKKGQWRGTDVALKILQDENVDYTEFVIEMNILSRLHHPNILQLLGSSTTTSPYIIVMEYMKNNSLEKQNGLLDYKQKLNILKDISRGLAYLHNRKPECIIHRDLKPSNILLTQSYKAKISDFGISCLQLNSNENYKMTGETGTYRYMAPEVLKHENYSCKVDIWSFGMILYYMFVDVPYRGLTVEYIINDIATNKLNLNDRYLSSSLKLVFTNCVKYDPKLRWDSLILVNYCNNEIHIEDEVAVKPKYCFCI